MTQIKIFCVIVPLRSTVYVQELEHPAIVQLLDVVYADKAMFLIFEHLDKVGHVFN